MTDRLCDEGYMVNHKRIARLMRIMGIQAITPGVDGDTESALLCPGGVDRIFAVKPLQPLFAQRKAVTPQCIGRRIVAALVERRRQQSGICKQVA